MKRLLLSLCFTALPLLATATPASDHLTPDQARRDLKVLKRAFTDLHPGLYRYQTPAQIDTAFAEANAEIADGSDVGQMFLIVSKLAAEVRCGHTWTNPLNQPERVRDTVFARADKLPLHLRLLRDDRLLVTASSNPAVAANEELLAIDGRSTAVLVAELLPYLRADGSSDGKRRAQINSGVNGGALDRLLPLLHAPVSGVYHLSLRNTLGKTREAEVAAVSEDAREAALQAAGFTEASDDWRFTIRDGVGLLTLPTFSFWRSTFDWHGFLDRSFAELASQQVTRLVIDLRRNEGGDSAVGDALLSHLLHAPYTVPGSHAEVAYERAPYELARFLDTWDFGFFDHTGHVEATGGRNFRLTDQTEGARVIAAVARPFRGSAIALTGPDMSSAGYLIARDLKASGAAVLLGRPTGGNLRGLNGGQLAWITLPNSGVSVDIPLVAWLPAQPQPDSPVQPDVVVEPTLEAVANGDDPELSAALKRLAKRSP